jgi:hypothetical protein
VEQQNQAPPEPATRSRDDFPSPVKELLAKRVGQRCSNPGCRQATAGPQEDPSKAINIGVAAHIAAASPGGPRFDLAMSPEDRAAPGNGIWLCQTCGKLVDNDPTRYPSTLLNEWKATAENRAAKALEIRTHPESGHDAVFAKIERLMPELIAEMRTDLAGQPLCRELIMLPKGVSFWYPSDRTIFTYYQEDHPDLGSKLRILQNHGLIHDIRHNDVPRYSISEAFAEFLEASALPRSASQ